MRGKSTICISVLPHSVIYARCCSMRLDCIIYSWLRQMRVQLHHHAPLAFPDYGSGRRAAASVSSTITGL